MAGVLKGSHGCTCTPRAHPSWIDPSLLLVHTCGTIYHFISMTLNYRFSSFAGYWIHICLAEDRGALWPTFICSAHYKCTYLLTPANGMNHTCLCPHLLTPEGWKAELAYIEHIGCWNRFLIFIPRLACWHCWIDIGLAIHRSQVWVLSGHHCAVALGKLLTPVCLCHQAA